MDDEPVLANLAKQMLQKLGYKVVTRTSGVDALELFRNRPEVFDLVITDMTMPRMTGAELAKELMQIRPDIPVILCTGFSYSMSEAKAKAIGIREFAMNPSSCATLQLSSVKCWISPDEIDAYTSGRGFRDEGRSCTPSMA